MSIILIVVLLVLLLGGSGAFYGSRAGWRGPHFGGGLLGLVVLVVVVLWITGNLVAGRFFVELTMLTLRTLGTSGSGPVIGSEPYRYEVIGLPTGRGAMIARLSGVWKILRIERGKNYAWTGSFVSADDALTSLEGNGSG